MKTIFPKSIAGIAMSLTLLLSVTIIKAQDPYYFYNFNENTGSQTFDSVHNSIANIEGENMWQQSLFTGSAIQFTNGFEKVALADSNLPLSNQFGLSLWIYISDETPDDFYDGVISRGEAAYPFAIRIMGGLRVQIMVNIEDETGVHYITCQQALEEKRWFHISVTYNNQYIRTYINGQLDTEEAATGLLRINGLQETIIGSRESKCFIGKIDNVRLFDFCPTPTDVMNIFNFYKDDIAPSIPASLEGLGVKDDSIRISFQPSTDNSSHIDYYRVYRDGTALDTLLTSTTYLDTIGLTPSTTYTYRVTAFDETGNESNFSNEINVSTLGVGESNGPTARFRVEPGFQVEVGQPVYFEAWESTDDFPLTPVIFRGPQGEFRWDFGDGYVMLGNVLPRNTGGSGPTVLHYYMAPGVYPAKLYVEDTDGNIDSVIHEITVTGEAPMEGFELWHAPFNCRISQYLFAQIPQNMQGSSNRLKITLTSDNDYSEVLVDKGSLASEEVILLNNSELPAGNYTMTTELLDGSGEQISYIKETFPKPYDGMPRIGIDKNNATCINGEPVFLIKPWMQNHDQTEEWADRILNCVRASGWYPEHSVETWKHYLDFAQENGLMALGPGNYPGEGVSNRRKNDIREAIKYIEETKDHPALFGWMWVDEPNMGGGAYKVPGQVCAAFGYKCRTLDPEHAVWLQLYGHDYIDGHIRGEYPYYPQKESVDEYDYLFSAPYFGGKKHFSSDMLSFDIYPIEFRHGRRLSDPERGPIDHWVKAMDNMIDRNYDLIPCSQSIAVSNCGDSHYFGGNDPTPRITGEQLNMLLWLCIAHNMKGINYFHYFEGVEQDAIDVMEQFKTDMDLFTSVVLGPDSVTYVSDSSNIGGNRVDFIARENDSTLFIFSARLTEIMDGIHNVVEPVTITTTFFVESDEYTQVEVYNEDRTIEIIDGKFTDTYNQYENHIYILKKETTDSIDRNSTQLKLWPQPFSNELFLDLGNSRETLENIRLYDIQGKLLGEINETSSSRINLLAEMSLILSEGIYLIRIETNSETFIKKAVKN